MDEAIIGRTSVRRWSRARVSIGSRDRLISVRAGSWADEQELEAAGRDDSVAIARYAVALAAALVNGGEDLDELRVESRFEPTEAGTRGVELHIQADVRGLDDAAFTRIAEETLLEQHRRGAWGTTHTRVKATKLPAVVPPPRPEVVVPRAPQAAGAADAVPLTPISRPSPPPDPSPATVTAIASAVSVARKSQAAATARFAAAVTSARFDPRPPALPRFRLPRSSRMRPVRLRLHLPRLTVPRVHPRRVPIVVLVTGAGVVVAALLLSLLAAGGLPGTISTLAGSDIAGVQSSSVSPAATANAPIGAAPPQVEAVEPEDAALPPPSGAPAAEDQALDSSQSAALGADAKPTIAVATEAPPTPAPSTILAFTADRRPSPAWPSDQTSIAWFAPDGYHLFARQAQEFVAIGIMSDQPADAVVNARFQKLDGPPGGGYGIVVRDQGPGPRDGLNQGGQYYVLEVGDRGEVGIWRRDQDHWVDLVPWSPSAAVRPGTAENALTVTASGDRLSLAVNGTQVASISDAALHRGTVGVFVGGDQNHTLLKEITVERAD